MSVSWAQASRWAKPAALPLALFLLVLGTHTHGSMGCADSRWSIPTAVSFVDHGDFDLDEYLPALQARQFYYAGQYRGHYYTLYPFGASVLAAPAVVVLRPIARVAFRLWPSLRERMERAQGERGCPPIGGEPIISLHSWAELIIASTIVAATTVVVYAIARAELSVGGAALLALVFAFGTSAWSTASRSLWQHGPSMLMLALALLVQVRRWPLVFMGLALGFAYGVRPTNSLPLALGTAWVVLNRPRRLPQYLAGAAAMLIPFFMNNRHVYGEWLSPYYHAGYFNGNVFFKEALAGDLISPGRGLFVYSPIFLFAVAGVFLKLRQRRFSTLDLSLAVCVVVHWIAVAWVNQNWWAGGSYGPRFFADMLPYLMYFLIPVIAWMRVPARSVSEKPEHAPSRPASPAKKQAFFEEHCARSAPIGARSLLLGRAPSAHRQQVAWLFAVAVVASVLMHAQGVLNPAALAWNGGPENIDANPRRLWDWRHPPFLAGWQATPPAFDIRSIACDAPPGAPADLTLVSNSGNILVGSWRTSSGVVARYIIESGSAPGLNDLPEREVRDTTRGTVTIDRVPPGIYYGRVRAENACGVSPRSNEIRVVVK